MDERAPVNWLNTFAILRRDLRCYYAERRAWIRVLVCSTVLAYGGGAVLFWFHSIYLGKGGPAISPWLHWLVDSTVGFVSLTPVVGVLLPLAARLTTRARVQGLLAGALLALVTSPAPVLHDELIGRGTWLAGQVTRLLGDRHEAAPSPVDAPWLQDVAQQVLVATPTYALLLGLTLLLMGTGRRSTPVC